MKWFKHDSNASIDAKVEKLMMKYGLEGYGLYFYCLEMIARTVESHNLTFELEHDAELIAHRLNKHPELIQEMMTFMVDLGLFENDRGVITCLKLATRTDEYTAKLINKNNKLHLVQTNSRHSPDTLPEKSELIEENRIEENREDKKKKPAQKKKTFQKPSIQDCIEHCKNRSESESFFNYYESNGWRVGRNKMVCWKSSLTNWVRRSSSFSPESKEKEMVIDYV